MAAKFTFGKPASSVDIRRRVWVRHVAPTFARNVREARVRANWSQGQVAHEMNEFWGYRWHQTTVAKVENGEREVKLKEACALAVILGTTIDHLIGEDPVGQHPEAP